MENWEEDFSTVKGHPKSWHSQRRSLSSWQADIPIADGDVTLKRGQLMPSADLSFDFDDGDEDFAADFESAVKTRKPQVHYEDNLPDAFLSDSTSRSPGRSSISSAASASSVATSWDCDEDDLDLELKTDDPAHVKLDLAARFRARQERARAEAAAEAAQLQANYAKTVTKNRSPTKRFGIKNTEDDDEDLYDLGLEQLTLKVKNGTVNKNIKLQPPSSSPHAQSKLLRGMRSIAQLPQKRSSDVAASARLRSAVSMLDLSNTPQISRLTHSQSHQNALSYQAGLGSQAGNTPFSPVDTRQQGPGAIPTAILRQRPLTAYREPMKKPQMRKQRSKKLNVIQNPLQTLKRQERDGMVLNPQTGMWEGNDFDDSRFDQVEAPFVRPTLITKRSVDNNMAAAAPGMIFDSRTLSWVYANEEEYDDPFEGIDEGTVRSTPSPSPQTVQKQFVTSHSHTASTQSLRAQRSPHKFPRSSRVVTNESMASTATAASNNFRNSVARSETSGQEVFEISSLMAAEWRHADDRFMRKFGKWIGGDEERADTLQSDKHFFEMVKNA